MSNEDLPAPDALPIRKHGHGLMVALGYTADQMHAYARAAVAPRDEQIARLTAEVEALRGHLDIALRMLAAWCVAVDVNGTGWDDWDEHYKDAAYRPGPLRELLDAAIAEERAAAEIGKLM